MFPKVHFPTFGFFFNHLPSSRLGGLHCFPPPIATGACRFLACVRRSIVFPFCSFFDLRVFSPHGPPFTTSVPLFFPTPHCFLYSFFQPGWQCPRLCPCCLFGGKLFCSLRFPHFLLLTQHFTGPQDQSSFFFFPPFFAVHLCLWPCRSIFHRFHFTYVLKGLIIFSWSSVTQCVISPGLHFYSPVH